jgi:hypothetical protein
MQQAIYTASATPSGNCLRLEPLVVLKRWRSIVAAVLCSAFAFWCVPASAQWQLLSTDAQAQYYIGEDIQREGDRISLWRLSNFVKPLTNLEGKDVLSEKTRTTLDCSASKLANSEVTRFAGSNGQGEVMNHYETPLRFTRIAPDSVDAVLMQKLCAH